MPKKFCKYLYYRFLKLFNDLCNQNIGFDNYSNICCLKDKNQRSLFNLTV